MHLFMSVVYSSLLGFVSEEDDPGLEKKISKVSDSLHVPAVLQLMFTVLGLVGFVWVYLFT